MRVFLALFFCVLLVPAAFSATIGLDLTNVIGLATCLTGAGCDLLSVLESTPGAGDTLSLNAVSLTGASNFNLNSAVTVAGLNFSGLAGSTLNVAAGAVTSVTGAVSVGASTTLQVAGQLTASGLVSIASAAAFVVAAGGSANFNGGVNVDAGATGSNQGLVVQNSASASISASSNINGALNLLAGSAFYIKSGTVTCANDVSAAGNTTVWDTLALTSSTATYTQTQGNLIIGSATATSAQINGNVNINSANFSGVGTINNNLNINAGSSIAPGNSPGTIFVNGNFALTSTSTFNLEIASDTSFDKVIVQGTASINGILYATLDNNFVPSGGDKFTFITSIGATSGTFNIVHGDYNSNLGKWSQQEDSHSVAAIYSSAATVAASLLLIVISVVISLL